MFNFNLKSMKKNYWLCKTFLLAAMGLSSVAIQGYASSDVLSVAGIEQQKTIQVTGSGNLKIQPNEVKLNLTLENKKLA